MVYAVGLWDSSGTRVYFGRRLNADAVSSAYNGLQIAVIALSAVHWTGELCFACRCRASAA